jgi:cytochrome c553
MWGMAAHLTDPLIQGLAAYYSAQTPVPGTPGDPTDIAAGEKIFQEGIAARGVPPCQGCHGQHAEGMATIPRLAGQHREYIVEQLENFASNARANEIMHENSKNLTADEIRQVTAYLTAQ